MIVCPVCSHQNDDFVVTCSQCGSYVQDRVPTLDFFATLWLIIESPKKAFKKIILAEHKNYVIFLGLFFGVAMVFALMWGNKSGNYFDNLFPVLFVGTFLGIVASVPLFYLLAYMLFFLAKVFKGKGKFKETYAVAGWSLAPILFSVVIVLPLEFATLGLYLVSSNPTAYEVKPLVTSVLFGLDGLLIVWSLILGIVGISMAHKINYVVSSVVVFVGAGAVGYLSLFLYSLFII